MLLVNRVSNTIRVTFLLHLYSIPSLSWFSSHNYQEENLASFSDVSLSNFGELPMSAPINCGQKLGVIYKNKEGPCNCGEWWEREGVRTGWKPSKQNTKQIKTIGA